jgi:hypothetical protein
MDLDAIRLRIHSLLFGNFAHFFIIEFPTSYIMAGRYREYPKLNLPLIEQEMLSKWNDIQAFEKSISLRDAAPSFVFYEGPPSANGLPGIHHVISRTLKDLVCRYKRAAGIHTACRWSLA